MPMSSYLKDKVVNIVLKGDSATAFKVPNIWVALFTGDPNTADTLSLVEVSAPSYARLAVPQTAGTGFETVSLSGIGSLQSSLEFPRALESWGTITHVGIVDAASGTTQLLFYGTIVNHVDGVTISVDEIFRLQSGELVVTVA